MMKPVIFSTKPYQSFTCILCQDVGEQFDYNLDRNDGFSSLCDLRDELWPSCSTAVFGVTSNSVKVAIDDWNRKE